MYKPSDENRRTPIVEATELPSEEYRSTIRRDSARLTHAPAFRRLQGKTQLFPGIESDYFRNRLTHSLEVGQIAKSIAIQLNHTCPELQEKPLDPDLVEFAGWCHDLGHPPFGHQGELALDQYMADDGGFEGNAQTLRILSVLEKRQHGSSHPSGIDDNGQDRREGLNLSARSLASILKYDVEIPLKNEDRRDPEKITKGYYGTERDLVSWVKTKVAPGFQGKFKTIECQIMDIADDIAYSTYDLEDTFKAGFFGPLDMLNSIEVFEEVAEKATAEMSNSLDESDVLEVLLDLFGDLAGRDEDANDDNLTKPIVAATTIHATAARLTQDGYLRSYFTSHLIGLALADIEFIFNADYPALSSAKLGDAARKRVEILKHFTYEKTIVSHRVITTQFRATEIIDTIIKALNQDSRLLPDDVRETYNRIETHLKSRVLCDFVAGMTDRYALEFYGRIRSENPQTIFKPI